MASPNEGMASPNEGIEQEHSVMNEINDKQEEILEEIARRQKSDGGHGCARAHGRAASDPGAVPQFIQRVAGFRRSRTPGAFRR